MKNTMALQGAKIGRYRIERELGRGGMGIVFLAKDEKLGKQVALKTVSIAGFGSSEQNREQRRARFVREAKALAQLNHGNVVHVFDVGEEDSPDVGWVLFYSMEYVEGITLAQLVHQKGPLEPEAAAAICFQVAAGLGAAHAQGIVHRDVKPGNIFITPDGRAVIGDFGICKIEGGTQITRRNQMVGTPNYLAPEQILGDEIGPFTDVFALGALFYIIVAHRALRTGVDATSLLRDAQSNIAKEKIAHLKIVPTKMRKVLARSLERDPAKRFKDGQSFAEALSVFHGRVPSFDDSDETLRAANTSNFEEDTDSLSAFQPILAEDTEQLGDPSFLASEESQQGDRLRNPMWMDQEHLSDLLLGSSEITAMFNARQIADQVSVFIQNRADLREKEKTLFELQISSVSRDERFADRSSPRSQTKEKKIAAKEKGSNQKVVGADRTVASRKDSVQEPSRLAAKKKRRSAQGTPEERKRKEPKKSKEQPAPRRVKPEGASAKTSSVKEVELVEPVRSERPRQKETKRNPKTQGGMGGIIFRAKREKGLLATISAALFFGVLTVWLLPTSDIEKRSESMAAGEPDATSSTLPKTLKDSKRSSIPEVCRGKAANQKSVKQAATSFEGAESAFRNRLMAEAEEKVSEALRMNPQNADGHFLYAQIYEINERYDKAQQHYDCVLLLEPNSPNAGIARERRSVKNLP
jgi:serine/threonine protein kinase